MSEFNSYVERITSFISNMRIKDSGGDTPIPPSMYPFFNGEQLKGGRKLKFDKSYDWNTFLAGLDYEQYGGHYFVSVESSASNHFTIMASTVKEGVYALMVIMSDGSHTDMLIPYVTEQTEVTPGVVIGPGWVDTFISEDGTIEITPPYINRIVVEDTSETWNGTMIGTCEEYFYPFVYDKSNYFNKIIFDKGLDINSKEYDATLEQELIDYLSTVYYESGEADLVKIEVDGAEPTSFIKAIDLSSVGAEGYAIMTPSNKNAVILYASKEGAYGGLQWKKGLQNLGSDYTYEYDFGEQTIKVGQLATQQEVWNGTMIGVIPNDED